MANWVTTELSQQTWTVKPPHDMLGRRRSKIDLGIQFQYVLAFSVGLRRLQLNDLSNVSLFLPFLLSPSNNTSGKALAVLFQKKVHFWYSCSWGNKIRQVRLGTKLRSVLKQPLYQESPCQLFARLSYLPPSRRHQTHQFQLVSRDSTHGAVHYHELLIFLWSDHLQFVCSCNQFVSVALRPKGNTTRPILRVQIFSNVSTAKLGSKVQ